MIRKNKLSLIFIILLIIAIFTCSRRVAPRIMDEPTIVDESIFGTNSISYYPNGQVMSGTLSSNQEINGVIFNANVVLTFI